MKIKPEHYVMMRDAIHPLSARIVKHREALEADTRVKDIEKRLRWDCLYAAKIDVNPIYAYANDDHIDTALRRVMATLPA